VSGSHGCRQEDPGGREALEVDKTRRKKETGWWKQGIWKTNDLQTSESGQLTPPTSRGREVRIRHLLSTFFFYQCQGRKRKRWY